MKLEMLVVMVLALASTNLSATEDVAVPVSEPGQAAPATIEGRIAALEAELAKARVELKESQRKLGALAVENARLKGLCQAAGIDSSAKPTAPPGLAAVPPDRIDPQVREFIARWNRPFDPNRRGGFFEKPTVGGVGTLPYVSTVISVADPKNMLVRTQIGCWGVVSAGRTQGTFSSSAARVLGASSRRVRSSQPYFFWISGYATGGLVDNQPIRLPGVFRVKGTRQYLTAGGSTSTVFELQPFDVDAYLTGLAAPEPVAAPAERIEPALQEFPATSDPGPAVNWGNVFIFGGNTRRWPDGSRPFLWGTMAQTEEWLRERQREGLLSKWELSPEFGGKFWIDPDWWVPLEGRIKWELLDMLRGVAEKMTGNSNTVIYSPRDDTTLAYVAWNGAYVFE